MNESETQVKKLLSDAPMLIALDTETTGLTWSDKAFMISFAWESVDLESGYIDLRTDYKLWDELKKYIDIADPKTIWHNAKFDFHKLSWYPENFEDTCLMIYLLNEHHPKGLKTAAELILKETTDEADVLKEERRKLKLKKADGYQALPVPVVGPYARKDAEFTLKLYSKLANALEKIPTVAKVYSLEKQLLLDVCAIERNGLGIDLHYVKNKIISLGDEIFRIERRIEVLVNKPVGKGKDEFNPHSPKQLLDIFTSMGYTVSGTGIEELKKINHELADLIVSMRLKGKLKSTYLESMRDEAVNGICHPNFNLTQTVTKRFSSSGASE